MAGIALFLGYAVVAGIFATIAFRALARRDLDRYESWRISAPERFRDAVWFGRIEATIASVLAFLFMLATPNLALAIDGEEELAIALLLFGGFLFWLSLRLAVWGWRTKLS